MLHVLVRILLAMIFVDSGRTDPLSSKCFTAEKYYIRAILDYD